MSIQASTHIGITSGWKYQLTQDFFYPLKSTFTVLHPFQNEYYALARHADMWWITARRSCCYDGPTSCPDFHWSMVASLVHDILHWLIAQGAISEDDNDLIDTELGLIIREGKEPIPWNHGGERMRPLYAFAFRKATGLVDQRYGEQKPITYYRV